MALSSAEIQDQARSDNPTQIFTNNSLGGLLYKCMATKQPFTVPQYSTLNEYLQLWGDESLGQKNSRDFELKYVTYGLRGSNCYGLQPNGLSAMRVNGHQPIDQRLFVLCPLIARPLDNDLDEQTREKYRGRTVGTYNNQAYAVYWVKVASFEDYNPHELLVEVDEDSGNSQVIENPYVHKKDDLMNPEPPNYTSNGTVPVAKRYVMGSAIIDCSLDATELAEIVNACKIVFGDPSVASINEVSVMWGIDTKVGGDITGGAQIRYNEALSMIPAHFLSEKDGRSAGGNSAITLRFDHGNSDPLLLATDSTTSSTGS